MISSAEQALQFTNGKLVSAKGKRSAQALTVSLAAASAQKGQSQCKR